VAVPHQLNPTRYRRRKQGLADAEDFPPIENIRVFNGDGNSIKVDDLALIGNNVPNDCDVYSLNLHENGKNIFFGEYFLTIFL
jgi:hypothetical protein